MKVRTEARRNAILETAGQLFQEMGYERASMNELAKRVGGSKATLYGYFASKEELFAAVVQSIATAHLSGAVDQLSEDVRGEVSLESALTRFGERMLQISINDSSALAVYRMVVAESGHSNVGQLFHDAGPAQAIKTLAAFMAVAMDRNELRRADSHVLALQFTALVTSEMQSRLYEVNPAPRTLKQIRAMVRRAVELFLNGAAAAP